MPLIKKIFKIGNGKALILPKSWLRYWEEKFGVKIEEVEMNIGEVLEITPYIPKKKGEIKHG